MDLMKEFFLLSRKMKNNTKKKHNWLWCWVKHIKTQEVVVVNSFYWYKVIYEKKRRWIAELKRERQKRERERQNDEGDFNERTWTLPCRSAGVRLPNVPLLAGTSGHATPPLFVYSFFYGFWLDLCTWWEHMISQCIISVYLHHPHMH